MVRFRRQLGSSLVLLLGIVATLAILTVTLVAVLTNAQGNTARERSQAKSFHVAEAALDAAMANISHTWPSAAPVPFPTAAFQDEFKPAASTTQPEYPGPTGADVPDVKVVYFDNSDTSGDGKINTDDADYDANGDQMIYVVAQAGVLKRSTRVQGLVFRSDFEPQIPMANVLWCSNLKNSGGGGGVMPKIYVENSDPLSNGEVAVDVKYNIDDYNKGIVDTSQIDAQFGSPPVKGHNSPKPLDEAYPPGARDSVVTLAKTVGRYFDADNASPGLTPLETAEASLESEYGGPGLAGLTVVRQTTPVQTFSLLGNEQLNAPPSDPGFLFLLGGVNFEIGGTAAFFGLLYVDGGKVTVAHGTPTIHGSMFVTGDVEFKGDGKLAFSYLALSGLVAKQYPSFVSMVPNTWRELQPK
jgi:type II secretory pathway pseudopilin PulG